MKKLDFEDDFERMTPEIKEKLETRLVDLTEQKRKIEEEKRSFNSSVAEQLKILSKKIYAISGSVKCDDLYILSNDLGVHWKDELGI
jgi:hypothetical protein